MKYEKFVIENYRAIKDKIEIRLDNRIIPLVGVNECGKTTILQGIFCFDYNNDKENAGKHLENIANLYATVDSGDCIISTTISCKNSEITSIIQKIVADQEKQVVAAKPVTSPAVAAPSPTVGNINTGSKFISFSDLIAEKRVFDVIEIKRNLSKEKIYFSEVFHGLSAQDNDLLCKKVINSLPYILYNDDFNDRPVPYISLGDEKDNEDWYAIFKRIFENKDFDIAKLLSCDTKRRKSILSSVEKFLNETLTEAWKKFSPYKQDISISLEVEEEKQRLNVYIKEEVKKEDRYFSVTDRSKGFIWYYNFIMKIRFNPKQAGDANNTIFLLDEPGSYLHETAQADLCKKLREISKKEGVVIYCTHSPQLLSPEQVPLNSIIIVEKSRNTRQIMIAPVSTKNDTQAHRDTAMQPIFEALQLPEIETIHNNEKILCVEGIYDKYCIECFCNLEETIHILASVSADAILNNIQYFIAYQKEYLALWDNDPEGQAKKKMAEKTFGSVEAKNFDLLPKTRLRGKTRMEEMIVADDMVVLRTKLNLPSNANYRTVIQTLRFTPSKEQKSILSSISQKTKDNFDLLSKILSKHFNSGT